MSLRGSCLCGTLRFAIDAPVTSMRNCHCSRCRKMHGAPFATYITTTPAALRWISGQEAVVAHAVAPGGARHFCGICGSVAPDTLPELDMTFVPAGMLDDDPGVQPDGHLFVGSKAPWHRITDAQPQHEHYPPEFGDGPGLPDDPRAPPDARIHGSCLCGEVAYSLVHPLAMFQCHCSRCRKSRGAAHGANLFCRIEDFQWLRGEQQVAEYKVPEAKHFAVAFCRRCGSAVPRVSKERGMVVVPAAGLDTDPVMRPMAHIFVGSKAPWHQITDAIPQYPEGPPSFGPPR